MKKTVVRKVDENGRLRIPAEILHKWHMEYGGEVIVELDETGLLVIPKENDVKTLPQ